ncbi:MAG: HyaD/HybD family hydrogenase maturation endopeptidase [Anaerolineae bacterium]
MAKGNRRGAEGRSSAPRTLILGVGNILLQDEGFGVHLVQAMEGLSLPPHVDLLDGGTAALDLLNYIADYDRLIVIDAVRGGSEPGAVYRFTPEDITPESKFITSVHQIDLLDVLGMAEQLGCRPREIIIYGVEPKEVSWGLELTPELAALVPKVVELILKEIA